MKLAIRVGVVLGLLALLVACSSAPTTGYEDEVSAAVVEIGKVAAKGPFQPSWESLKKYEVPEWYLDAKFGIFIHWGAYSVPAYGNEWYPRRMYLQNDDNKRGLKFFEHHVETYGPQTEFGYKDFIPQFKAENFDATAWAELFKNAGAKYVVPVAEHHDGFPLYECSYTDWDASKMGPKRDVIAELEKAVRAAGMHFGASSHRAEHWWFFDGGMKFPSDVQDPKYFGLYGPAQPKRLEGADKDNQPDKAFLDDWLARTAEIVDKYQPEIVWFDWWIEEEAFVPYLQEFAAYYYNRGAEWNKGVAINYKNEAFPPEAAVFDVERGKLDDLRKFYWQTDTSVSIKSWGYIDNDTFRSPDSLVDDLIDITSKNGCLLLNVGPKSDGTIPEQAQQILLEMGKWLQVNGEAIYGTRPWEVFGEGPTEVIAGSFKDTAGKPFTGQDIRFTKKGDTLYAISLAWPESGKVTVESLAKGAEHAGTVKSVELLGHGGKLRFNQTSKGLVVNLPKEKPCDFAYSFKITI